VRKIRRNTVERKRREGKERGELKEDEGQIEEKREESREGKEIRGRENRRE